MSAQEAPRPSRAVAGRRPGRGAASVVASLVSSVVASVVSSVVVSVGSLAACSSGYDISLEVSDTVNAACNTSCVQSVSVEVMGAERSEFTCLQNVTVPTLREHGLDGKVDLPVPESIQGVWVMGWRGPSCGLDTLIFDGVTRMTGGDTKVPMKCVASCSAEGAMQVHSTSLLAVAQGTCSTSDATAASAGVLRASQIDQVFPGEILTEFFGPASTPLTGGTGTLARGVVATASPLSCSAVALYKDGAPINISCVRFGVGGLCGAAGKTEVAYYASPPLADFSSGYRVVGVFAKKGPTAGTTVPVANATVTLDKVPNGRIEYLTLDATKTSFKVEPGRTATDGSGAFAVYAKEPMLVTVTGPDGTKVSRMVGGGTVYGTTGEPVVVAGAMLFTPD